MIPTDPSVAVFSLGQDGYDVAFGDAVASQRAYCDRYGYSYTCVNAPGSILLGRENIWLKALAIYGALLKNNYVLYLDTDVQINPNCPPITQALYDDEPIGLVAGHSGRVNAGVIIAKRDERSLSFLAEWVASLGKPISARDDVGWGENGHLIRLSGKYNIKLLNLCWNNTYDDNLSDYMRHYTGPMREKYKFDEVSKLAWDKININARQSKELGPLDILTTFSELKKVYQRSLPPEMFADFDVCWSKPSRLMFSGAVRSNGNAAHDGINRVYIAEEISAESKNAYVVTLKDGLERVLGSNRVSSGVQSFWEGSFTSSDVLHIEWMESLFGWKIPSDEQLEKFERRMRDISKSTCIVYTAHNFDLMPTYAERRQRILEAFAKYGSLILHLSSDNIDAFNAHHLPQVDFRDVPTAIVPHGDYQPYFRLQQEQFVDSALDSNRIKILVFGHIRTRRELDFCLNVNAELDSARFQLFFAGAIHSEIIHWKEIHRLRDNWDGGARRIHLKVPADQVLSLVKQCDGVLIPRFDRLNSGVQFLAYSMLKPAFVPDQYSMGQVQEEAMGIGIYCAGDVRSAAAEISKYFDSELTSKLEVQYNLNRFNYTTQDSLAVGIAHKNAYKFALKNRRWPR